MQEPRIVGINGSPHMYGPTVSALEKSLSQASREDADPIGLIHLREFISEPFKGDFNKPGADLQFVLDSIKQADGLIFATPVHWFNISSLMKILIDEMSRLESPGFPLEGTVAGFIATCEEDGGMQACLQMAAPLVHMGCIVAPYGLVFKNVSISTGGENGWQDNDLALLGSNVTRLAKATKKYRRTWDYKNMTK